MMKMITLKSSDNETFEIEEAVANGSQTIKHVIEDDCAESAIPLPNVDSKILSKVIEYLKRHVGTTASAAATTTTETETADDDDDNKKAETEALKAFDKEFVKVDQSTLFDLTVAANYLDIKGLLDLTCQTIADLIKEKTPKEIRQIFNIKNEFTPEEEEDVQRKNAWAFE